jgi:Protein of unknown function (DUF3261)
MPSILSRYYFGLLCACAVWGCQPNPSQPTAPSSTTQPKVYPGTLRPPAAFGPNFQWRQRITASWSSGERSFDAVLSKDGDTLQLLGLNPMGMPGFVLKLQGTQLQVQNNTSQAIPFEPRYVMLDVERVFFPWFDAPSSTNGERELKRDGELVRETWKGGQLSSRRFKRLDGKPAGEIVITYSNWPRDRDAPARAHLANGWFGYALTIETVEQQRLP